MKRFCFIVLFLMFSISFRVIHAESSLSDTLKPELVSSAAILMEPESGRILYEKNAYTRMFPASTTKNLVALLALENLDMDETAILGDELKLIAPDSSTAGLKPGDRIAVSELLRALMLRSGNDAAYSIAVLVAGKKSGNPGMEISEAISYFVGMMNERAREIGATDSHFVNPDGYHDDNHYSTAYDLCLIAREAMKHELFREIARTYSYSKENAAPVATDPSELAGQGLWENRNELINPEGEFYYEYATGIKTGYTNKAGYCLVSSAEMDGLQVIGVTLNSPSEEGRWDDSRKLLAYGLENFTLLPVLKTGMNVARVSAARYARDEGERLEIQPDKDFNYLIAKQDISEIKYVFAWDPDLLYQPESENQEIKLKGPFVKGQKVGSIRCMLRDEILFECGLIAGHDTASFSTSDEIMIYWEKAMKHPAFYIACAAILLIVLIFVRLILKGIRRKRKRYIPKYRNLR